MESSLKQALMASAIEAKYHCQSFHLASAPVEDLTNGNVEIFELAGHPTAKRCYTWIEGPRCEYVIILQTQHINSPKAAVRKWTSSKHPVVESIVTAPHWHMQQFLTVGTIDD